MPPHPRRDHPAVVRHCGLLPELSAAGQGEIRHGYGERGQQQGVQLGGGIRYLGHAVPSFR